MREFTTTGGCNPVDHYMVDITERLEAIKKLVDDGKYFCINRARQYGKTTTLDALSSYLADDYTVVSLDFQDIGNGVFNTEGSFAQGLARLFLDAYEFSGAPIPSQYLDALRGINNED